MAKEKRHSSDSFRYQAASDLTFSTERQNGLKLKPASAEALAMSATSKLTESKKQFDFFIIEGDTRAKRPGIF